MSARAQAIIDAFYGRDERRVRPNTTSSGRALVIFVVILAVTALRLTPPDFSTVFNPESTVKQAETNDKKQFLERQGAEFAVPIDTFQSAPPLANVPLPSMQFAAEAHDAHDPYQDRAPPLTYLLN